MSVEGPSQLKGRGLSFELQGEGNLPQVSVVSPSTRGPDGNHYLLFTKQLVGHKEVLAVVLGNSGNIPATVTCEMDRESEGQFMMSPVISEEERDGDHEEREEHPVSAPIVLRLPERSTRKLMISFRPQEVVQFSGSLWIRVQHNQYESHCIRLIGEGFTSDVIVDNVRAMAPLHTDIPSTDIEGTLFP